MGTHSGTEPYRVEARPVSGQEQALPPAASSPTSTSGPVQRVNINTADAAELETLPGIGEKRAADIIADRTANGPFRIPEDIARVPGIGSGTLERIIDYITVE